MSSQTDDTTIPSTYTGLTYTPSDSWLSLQEPGATNGQSEFLLGDNLNGRANAYLTCVFSQPFTGIEYWGYQRSDGGLFSICFDCPPTYTLGDHVDALNASTNGSEPPRLLYSDYDLSYAVHNLTIANLFDTRATIGGATNGAYGQMTFDRFVLIAPSTPPTTATEAPFSPVVTPSTSSEVRSPSVPSSSSSSSTGTEATSSSSTTSNTETQSTAPPTTSLMPTSHINDITSASSAMASSPTSTSSSVAVGSSKLPSSNTNPTSTIAGGVVGGIGGIAVVVALLFFLWQRRKRRQAQGVQLEGQEQAFELKDDFILHADPAGSTVRGSAGQAVHDTERASLGVLATSHGSLFSAKGHRLRPSTAKQYGVGTAQRPAGANQTPTAFNLHGSDQRASPVVSRLSSASSWPSNGDDTTTPRRDEDAGFLQGDEDEIGDDARTLPPDYDSATARRREMARP